LPHSLQLSFGVIQVGFVRVGYANGLFQTTLQGFVLATELAQLIPDLLQLSFCGTYFACLLQ
jgi:hypothetical protein